MFEKLGDDRMRAAALLVQSHICIKSKNQEKEKRAAEALKSLGMLGKAHIRFPAGRFQVEGRGCSLPAVQLEFVSGKAAPGLF